MWIGSFGARTPGYYGLAVIGTNATHAADIVIRDVTVQNMPIPLFLRYADRLHVERVSVVMSIAGAVTGNAVEMNSVIGGLFLNCQSYATNGLHFPQSGWVIDYDCDTCDFVFCSSSYCTERAWYLVKSGGATAPRICKFVVCSGEESEAGFLVAAARNAEFHGCGGAANDHYGLGVVGGDAIQVLGGYFQSNGRQGIVISGGNGEIMGASCANNSVGNTGVYSGIDINNNASHWRVIGGRSGNWVFPGAPDQAYGLNITAGTDHITVFGIDCSENATGTINHPTPGANSMVLTRKGGWTAATGTASRATFATGSVTLEQLAQRVKALVDDLNGGVIGS